MTRSGFLRLLSAILMVALVWWQFDSGDAAARLYRADAGWIIAALAMLWVQVVLSAWRWRLAARQAGIHITPLQAVREYHLAQLVNQTLPGGVVGDVARAYRSSEQAGIIRAGQAVLFERSSGQVAMLLVLVVGISATILVPGGITLPSGLVASVLAIIALAAIVAVFLCRSLPAPLLAPRFLWTQFLLGLAAALLIILAFDASARATGTALPLPAVFTLLPLILFTMVVPITVSGWGLREGAAGVIFPLAGASTAAGLAASTMFGLLFLTSSVLGVLFMAAIGGWNAPRGQRVEQQGNAPPPTDTEMP